jgi:hypothetical protein
VCQAGEKEANANEGDEGLRAACLTLVILAHPALSADPGNGALNNPPLGENAESQLIAQIGGKIGRIAPQLAKGWIDHLQALAVLVCGPGDEPTGVALIRPTAATLLLSRGVNPKVASEMLGHSSVSIKLDLYFHVLPHMLRGAADVMDEAMWH